jgi:hypothetical protein
VRDGSGSGMTYGKCGTGAGSRNENYAGAGRDGTTLRDCAGY